MNTFFDFVLHLDVHLVALVEEYGALVHGFLFLLVFCETGLVFTPFLPGDSLLFVAGTLAAKGALSVFVLWVVLFLAAVLGDSVNYSVGLYFGKRLGRGRFLKKEHLEKTQQFYEKYGKKTIVLARFVPIVRTFAPFVAGMARMRYHEFIFYNVVGALVWVTLLIFAGYFFGQMPWVRDNLEIVVLGIVFISILPAVVEFLKMKIFKR